MQPLGVPHAFLDYITVKKKKGLLPPTFNQSFLGTRK